MPRLVRMYIESQYLHIIVQGINKEYIFNGRLLHCKNRKIAIK